MPNLFTAIKKYLFFTVSIIFLVIYLFTSLDIFNDNKKDGDKGYQEYLQKEIEKKLLNGTLKDIAYPVRTLILDTKGKMLDQKDALDKEADLIELSSNLGDGKQVKKWNIKYEKKGNSRSICEPAMFNLSFDKDDLFSGLSTYQDNQNIGYKKIRVVPNCDINKDYRLVPIVYGLGGHLDAMFREYMSYKIFRMNKVPVLDVVGFANISFVSNDPLYEGKRYPYMFLQRNDEKNDEIPFVEQFNLESKIISDDEYGPEKNDFESDRISFVKVVEKNPKDGNADKNSSNQAREAVRLNLDPENSIRYFILADFLKATADRRTLINESYGKDLGSDLWKTVPNDFDKSFEGCRVNDPSQSNLEARIKNLPPEKARLYKDLYYKVGREIFSKPENLYQMLLEADKFPFPAEKEKMKDYLKVAWSKYARYFKSKEFARKTGQTFVPSNQPSYFPYDGILNRMEAQRRLSFLCKKALKKPPYVLIKIENDPKLEIIPEKWRKTEVSENVSYLHLKATYQIELTALDEDINIPKKDLFQFALYNEKDKAIQAAIESNYKITGITDLAGPFYLLKKGETGKFTTEADFWFEDENEGYKVKLEKLWFGSSFELLNAPDNETSSVMR